MWKFDDPAAHNVCSGPPTNSLECSSTDFHSDDLTTGTYEHTFTTPGDYTYNCSLHHGMNGEVVVTQ